MGCTHCTAYIMKCTFSKSHCNGFSESTKTLYFKFVFLYKKKMLRWACMVSLTQQFAVSMAIAKSLKHIMVESWT